MFNKLLFACICLLCIISCEKEEVSPVIVENFVGHTVNYRVKTAFDSLGNPYGDVTTYVEAIDTLQVETRGDSILLKSNYFSLSFINDGSENEASTEKYISAAGGSIHSSFIKQDSSIEVRETYGNSFHVYLGFDGVKLQ